MAKQQLYKNDQLSHTRKKVIESKMNLRVIEKPSLYREISFLE